MRGNYYFSVCDRMTFATHNIKAKSNPDFAYFKEREISQTHDTELSQRW